MKTLPLALALLLLCSTALGSPARAHAHSEFNLSIGDPPAHWGSRHDARDARIAITDMNDRATLVLTDELVAIQLSDRTLHRVRRELRDREDDDEDVVLAQAIKSVVISSVRALLNSSAEYSLRDLRDVRYDDGRLVLIARDGSHVFDHLDVDDCDVLSGFSDADARNFVREFHRAQGRAH